MEKENILNLQEIKNSFSFSQSSFNLGKYLYINQFKNPFLSLITEEETRINIKEDFNYTIEIPFYKKRDFKNTQEFLERLSFIQEKLFLEKDDILSNFLLKTLLLKEIPTLIWNNFYCDFFSQTIELPYFEHIIHSSFKAIAQQQAWNEWRNSPQKPKRGILEQIREKGIYIKSPLWHYDKALEKILEALIREESHNFFILVSPSTYHQILKKKLLDSYKNEIFQDHWDFKGKTYIPILTIAEIPNTAIIISNPKDFKRWIEKPFSLEEKDQESLIGKGSFFNELLKKESSAYIELYVN